MTSGCEYPGTDRNWVDCQAPVRWTVHGNRWKAAACNRHAAWALREATQDGKPAIVAPRREHTG